MPTNMNMSDLLNPALEAGNSGADQAIKSAQALNQGAQVMSNIKLQTQKQAELQQELTDKKYTSLTNRIQQQQNITDPKIRGRVADINDKSGLAYNGFFKDLHDNYNDDPNKNAALAKYLTNGKPSQDEMQNILSMAQDPTASHQGFELIKNKMQTDAMIAAAKLKADAMNGPGSTRQQAIDLRTHTTALKAVNDDKISNDLQTSYQNLHNSIANFKASDQNPEEFNQLQQSLRANAGIKGTSTGSERADSYLHDYGITVQQFIQKLSGTPQDVEKSSPGFVALVHKVADAELDNKRQQIAGQIMRKAQGYRDFYQDPRNEEKASAFYDTVASRYHQMGLTPPSQEELFSRKGGAAPKPAVTSDTAPAAPDAALKQRQQDFINKHAADFIGKPNPKGGVYTMQDVEAAAAARVR